MSSIESVRLSYLPSVYGETSNEKAQILCAVSNDGFLFEHLADEWRNDRDVALAAVRKNGFSLKHASFELRKDREVVREAVSQIVWAFEFADIEIRNDPEYVGEVVDRNGVAFQFAGDDLKAHRGIALRAIRQSRLAILFVSPLLLSDPSFMEEIKKN